MLLNADIVTSSGRAPSDLANVTCDHPVSLSRSRARGGFGPPAAWRVRLAPQAREERQPRPSAHPAAIAERGSLPQPHYPARPAPGKTIDTMHGRGVSSMTGQLGAYRHRRHNKDGGPSRSISSRKLEFRPDTHL